MVTKGKVCGPDPRFAYTYRELPIGCTAVGLSDDLMKTGTWRVAIRPAFGLKTPPCNEGCPAGVDVRGFIALLKQGSFEAAHNLYLEEHPFPAICGRVCFHPCEAACNRKDFDQAVSVNGLERFVANYDVPVPQIGLFTGKHVAIVGSGPAGMACSYYLRRLGHAVTVFESLKVIGGLLRTGIPDYRLPSDIVEKEVEKLMGLGIMFKTGQVIDAKTWQDLEQFDAIVLAHGASTDILPSFIPPESPKDKVISGLDLLRRVKLGEIVSLGRRVVIIGGGNTAIDAARVSLRLGASPMIVYRRSRAEMPAFKEEIEDALEEGIEVLFLTSPTGMEYSESGLKLKCVTNRLAEKDENGRAKAVSIAGSDFFIETDTIITAVGETPDLSFLPQEIIFHGQSISMGALGSTAMPAIFACGDIAGGPRTVVHAIGSAKKAAIAADRYIRRLSFENLEAALKIGENGGISFRRYVESSFLSEAEKVIHFVDLNTNYFTHQERQVRSKVPKEDRAGTTEVYGSLSSEKALAEAERCFGCGLCDYCGNCYLFCPDSSVIKQEGGETWAVDYEYCKGCAICANECPVGLIEMEKEG